MLGQFCEWLRLLPVRWKLALSAGAVLAPAAIIGIAGAFGVRLNLTNSVPIGLYVISNSPEARSVEFCPPEPFGTLSRERGYRERSQFGCPDGARPLLKPVVAMPGDVVDVSPRGIEVNGKLIPHTAALHSDSAGRSMAAWPMGTYDVLPSFPSHHWMSLCVASFLSTCKKPLDITPLRQLVDGKLFLLYSCDHCKLSVRGALKQCSTRCNHCLSDGVTARP